MKMISVIQEQKPPLNKIVLALNNRGYIGLVKWDGTIFTTFQDDKWIPIDITSKQTFFSRNVYLTHWIDEEKGSDNA